MYYVNDIFCSVQGEGPRVGYPAVFIRFSGCNLSCSFCDTDHRCFKEYSTDDLVDAVVERTKDFGKGMDCIITGGEPFLQLGNGLILALAGRGFKVSVETNGSVGLSNTPEKITRLQSIVTASFVNVVVSPKEDCAFSEPILSYASCLKALFPLPFGESFLSTLVGATHTENLVLQPVTPKQGFASPEWRDTCQEALAFIWKRKREHDEIWRLIPQTHVAMDLS